MINEAFLSNYTDYHLHTNLGDGKNSLPQMLKGALKIGLKTVAVTEHNFSVHINKRLRKWFPDLDILSGFELSSLLGHFVIVGVDAFRANRMLADNQVLKKSWHAPIKEEIIIKILEWAKENKACVAWCSILPINILN